MKLPILGVALCGALYAIIHIYGNRGHGAAAVAAADNGEEELFND